MAPRPSRSKVRCWRLGKREERVGRREHHIVGGWEWRGGQVRKCSHCEARGEEGVPSWEDWKRFVWRRERVMAVIGEREDGGRDAQKAAAWEGEVKDSSLESRRGDGVSAQASWQVAGRPVPSGRRCW